MLTYITATWNQAGFFDKDIYHIFTLKATLRDAKLLKQEHAKMREWEDTSNGIFIISSDFKDIIPYSYKKEIDILMLLPLRANLFLGVLNC